MSVQPNIQIGLLSSPRAAVLVDAVTLEDEEAVGVRHDADEGVGLALVRVSSGPDLEGPGQVLGQLGVDRGGIEQPEMPNVAGQLAAVILRYFALNGTGHATHEEQGSMIRRYIIWRNNHAYERLRRVVARASVA